MVFKLHLLDQRNHIDNDCQKKGFFSLFMSLKYRAVLLLRVHGNPRCTSVPAVGLCSSRQQHPRKHKPASVACGAGAGPCICLRLVEAKEAQAAPVCPHTGLLPCAMAGDKEWIPQTQTLESGGTRDSLGGLGCCPVAEPPSRQEALGSISAPQKKKKKVTFSERRCTCRGQVAPDAAGIASAHACALHTCL